MQQWKVEILLCFPLEICEVNDRRQSNTLLKNNSLFLLMILGFHHTM